MRSVNRTTPNKDDWHQTHNSPHKSKVCKIVVCRKCHHLGCLSWHKIIKNKVHLVVHHSHFLDENKFPQARNYHHKVLEALEG